LEDNRALGSAQLVEKAFKKTVSLIIAKEGQRQRAREKRPEDKI